MKELTFKLWLLGFKLGSESKKFITKRKDTNIIIKA